MLLNGKFRLLTVSELRERGVRNAQTLIQLNDVPLSTTYKYIEQLKKYGNIKPIFRPGRPRILTSQNRRVLGRMIQNDQYLTCGEIATKLSSRVKISARTVNRELNKLGYHSGHPKTVPLLTAKQRERRVEWAIAHARQNWKTVVFSDESTFQMFRNTMPAFYKAGTDIPQKGGSKTSRKSSCVGCILSTRDNRLSYVYPEYGWATLP